MKTKLIDTNIIIRFLVEDSANPTYQKIFELFEKLETKEESVFIDSIVIMEAYFVLTKVYRIPDYSVINSLKGIISFSGIEMENKPLINLSFDRMSNKKIDFVDAYLIELSLLKNSSIYTNDQDLLNSEAETIKLTY
jgi:predicted nucleic-acid-binding protein